MQRSGELSILTMVNASSSKISGGSSYIARLRRTKAFGQCCLAVLVGSTACGSLESEEAKEVAREANEVAQATQETISRGVDSAKEQLDKVDTKKIEKTWDGMVEAVEDSTKSDPTTPAGDPLAGAKQAIACDEARERCTVTAEFADRAREHGTRMAGQVRVTRVAGTVTGIRIDSIDSGTAAEIVGLKVGDVITHVNGTALGSAQDVMMLYMSVRSAQSFVVSYQRSGEARSLQVDVV